MSRIVLVTWVGAAAGSRGAAAALACHASEFDRAALLIEIGAGRPPRPTPIATSGARALEERLAAHMPDAAVASRGRICLLRLAPDAKWADGLPAALPLARESAAIVHLPPELLRPVLAEPRIGPTAVLLRADLASDRPLTALAVRDLLDRDLRVAVLKHPLGWLAERAALFGALPAGSRALPQRGRRLLGTEDKNFQQCYSGGDESRDGRATPEAGRSRA